MSSSGGSAREEGESARGSDAEEETEEEEETNSEEESELEQLRLAALITKKENDPDRKVCVCVCVCVQSRVFNAHSLMCVRARVCVLDASSTNVSVRDRSPKGRKFVRT